MTRPVFPSILLGLAVLFWTSAPVRAVTSQTWRQREKSDFEKGEPKDVSISVDGALRLSPRIDLAYEAAEPYIWALAQDDEGKIYAAGGNDGAIYRIGSSGKAEVFFRVKEPEVHALAVDASGNVLAGTAPGGRVYKIAPAGTLVWSYDSGEEYVWSLLPDPQGNLFAATGVEGRVLKIDAAGRGQVFFDSAETHVRSLVYDGAGELIAGTEGHGLVFRISPRGEGFVLYDAPLTEVVSLAVAPGGTIYAAVVGETGRGAPRAERAAPQPAPTPAPSAPADGGGPAQAPAPSQPQEAAPQAATEQRVPINMEGKVLAISPDGYAREVWSGSQEAILSLALSSDGDLLMGSSLQGRLYSLAADQSVTEIARAPSSQITALLSLGPAAATGKRDAPRGRRQKSAATPEKKPPAPRRREIAVAGSNFGTVSLLRPGHAMSGTFESCVLDARSFATWGRVSWRAEVPKGTSVAIGARCGNTEEPDRTWSDWGVSLANPEGSLLDCPASRFLQWRATMKTDDPSKTPALREVAVTYLQRNLPPEIKKVEVHAPGVSFQKVPASQSGGPQESKAGGASSDVEGGARRKPRPQSRRGFEPGARSVTWQATDPNEDDLVFDVFYRAIDEKTWKPIRSRIEEDFASLDSTAMPDGTYVFRIVANDAQSNPPGQSLTAEKISEHFDVDNTPPRVEALRAEVQPSATRLSFTVTDSFNIIREVAYSIDAGEWVLALPADGLDDSLAERHEVGLPPLSSGEHSIVVRATDSAGNVGAGRTVVQVP